MRRALRPATHHGSYKRLKVSLSHKISTRKSFLQGPRGLSEAWLSGDAVRRAPATTPNGGRLLPYLAGRTRPRAGRLLPTGRPGQDPTRAATHCTSILRCRVPESLSGTKKELRGDLKVPCTAGAVYRSHSPTTIPTTGGCSSRGGGIEQGRSLAVLPGSLTVAAALGSLAGRRWPRVVIDGCGRERLLVSVCGGNEPRGSSRPSGPSLWRLCHRRPRP